MIETESALSREAAAACSLGRKPEVTVRPISLSREAAADVCSGLCCRRFAVRLVFAPGPWADAHGYNLSPLRG